MADIFLSYAREDHDIASRLSSALVDLGWSVFLDQTYFLGVSLWSEGRFAEAVKALEEANSRFPGQVSIAYRLAFTRLEACDFVNAEQGVRSVIRSYERSAGEADADYAGARSCF